MDIEKLVAEYGAINLRFFIPMRRMHSLHGFGIPMAFTSSDDPYDITECVIDEDRYKVSEGYKVTFRAIDENYGYEHWYQMDFNNHCKRNDVSVFVLVDEDNKYEKIREY
jgi:hypothetical protein